MVPLHRGRFLVVLVHLYSSFSMDPLDFFLGTNLYQKIVIFGDFGSLKLKDTFLKLQR